MAYDNELALKVRDYLTRIPGIAIEEKKMFGGLAFLINGKMCVNVSGDSLMCRFDPGAGKEISGRRGYRPMIMKGKDLPGYCYVSPEGFSGPDDFSYWLELCLAFNDQASVSGSRKSK
ncbi:TfoX-like protein [Anseongella ginsenosidimutans]|uniref:TfoX-like protein n=1 Tax=Anseongella ginsenosidimutans TaxID=496056 RepID=A0A4R3KLA3_9SPHI|nr:TfoX/Sxy family protein [Anseongella ginsenosidimutans]QEC53570.1 TfoX/Sxy family protein [Anseongella ginsenosidimutans]TCS84640.1 TfoX-like protein [Anseongella ginsenosidimutans]